MTQKTGSDGSDCTIAFVLVPRFNMMALTATLEPLRVANYISGRTLYTWRFLSAEGDTVTASNGMSLATDALNRDDRRWDAIFVCSSWNSEHYENAELFNWLRRMDRLGSPLGSMCMGTYVLARAGLLSGYNVTLHWHSLRAFMEDFPNTTAMDRLYVIDRNRMTIAGGTAGLDMMLHDIMERHGHQLALEVAEQIVHYPIREPDEPQRKSLGGTQEVLHPVLRRAVALMEDNIEEPLHIPYLARTVGVSQRKLERLFNKHMGISAVGFYRMMRLEFARVLLTNTSLAIREVSVACGYSSLSHFAKSFVAQFGKRPRDYRESWPESAPIPNWPGTPSSLTKFAHAARRWNVDGREGFSDVAPPDSTIGLAAGETRDSR